MIGPMSNTDTLHPGSHTAPVTLLAKEEWRELAEAHATRVDELTRNHLERHARGEKHPMWDFLFDYYRYSPGKFRRWHPGVTVALEGECPHREWKYYRSDGGLTQCDSDAFLAKRGKAARYIADLLASTMARTAHFDCFCLHEWAMCYKTDTPRHNLPLRLGGAGVNTVVGSHDIRCTHYDAFRFFTPPARPLNGQQLTRESQLSCEQSGCLHATMDLYKWAFKLEPLVPSSLILQAFELACQARILDMQASPYDCAELGLAPIPVETTEGKAEFVHRQRALAEQGTAIRRELLLVLDAVGVRPASPDEPPVQ